MSLIITGLTDIALTFPKLSHDIVERDNILTAIDTMLDGETEAIILEGQEGIGRTVLLAQFARRHNKRAFSLFLRPISGMACDAHTVAIDLYRQMNWHISNGKGSLEPLERLPANGLQAKYRSLIQRANLDKKDYYFVVDGLQNISKDNAPFAEAILDLLPRGQKGFKYLISGDVATLPKMFSRGLRIKPYQLPPFSLDETSRFFEALSLSSEIIGDFHKAWRGLPSHLASIRRSLKAGEVASDICNSLHLKVPAPFEVEWAKVNVKKPVQKSVLELLAHSHGELSIKDFARLLKQETVAVYTAIENLTFIECSSQETDLPQFVSESFRRFAAEKLSSAKYDVEDVLIGDLLSTPESSKSLEYLPSYFKGTSRLAELVNFLGSGLV